MAEKAKSFFIHGTYNDANRADAVNAVLTVAVAAGEGGSNVIAILENVSRFADIIQAAMAPRPSS